MEKYEIVQLTIQSLILNNRQCNVLIFKDLSNVKKIALMEY